MGRGKTAVTLEPFGPCPRTSILNPLDAKHDENRMRPHAGKGGGDHCYANSTAIDSEGLPE